VENVVERTGFASGVGGVGFAIEGRKFARCTIGFHLPVPIVIGPTAKFGSDLSALFKRKHLDRSPDFFNLAHDQKICLEMGLFATVNFPNALFPL
jgi:hypothetical protein